jgi:hypothetical protein
VHHDIRATVEPDPEDGVLLDSVFPFVKRCLGEKFGAKWRKTIRGGAKHMSRMKASMRAISRKGQQDIHSGPS